jgi:hypothetical protein
MKTNSNSQPALEGEGGATLKEKLTFTASEVRAAWVFTCLGSIPTQQARSPTH